MNYRAHIFTFQGKALGNSYLRVWLVSQVRNREWILPTFNSFSSIRAHNTWVCFQKRTPSPRLQHTINSFLWFNRDPTQMLYTLICQQRFSASCDWMFTLWNSVEKVSKRLIRSHYDTWNHPRQRLIFYCSHIKSETKREEVGKKRKISLSFSYTQLIRWSK